MTPRLAFALACAAFTLVFALVSVVFARRFLLARPSRAACDWGSIASASAKYSAAEAGFPAWSSYIPILAYAAGSLGSARIDARNA